MGNSVKKTFKNMWGGIKKVGTTIYHGAKKIFPHVKHIVDRAKPLIAQMGPRGAAIAGGIETAEGTVEEIKDTVEDTRKKAQDIKGSINTNINKAKNSLNGQGLQKLVKNMPRINKKRKEISSLFEKLKKPKIKDFIK